MLAPEWRTLEECQFFLQECQIKFLIPSRISRKYQTLGNDYSATQKSLQARVPQQEQSNNEIGYRPAERNCFLLSSTKVCLPIPYTIRPKTLPHKMTRQPRVHTNPNAKTAEQITPPKVVKRRGQKSGGNKGGTIFVLSKISMENPPTYPLNQGCYPRCRSSRY